MQRQRARHGHLRGRGYPVHVERTHGQEAAGVHPGLRGAGPLWPAAVVATGQLDWDALMDPDSQHGEQRFDSQYWRANIDPSDRYVLSVKGSTKGRLRADESGFDNLYLAGDWTYTGLNVGCVE